MEKAKIDAKNGNKPGRNLYAEALNGQDDDVIARMPKQQTFTKRMRQQRKGKHPANPKSVEELVLPEITNSVGENFLFFDSGPSKERTIMFTTEKALKFMSLCDALYMDGTVQTGPVLFDQVYTIHGKFCLLMYYFL